MRPATRLIMPLMCGPTAAITSAIPTWYYISACGMPITGKISLPISGMSMTTGRGLSTSGVYYPFSGLNSNSEYTAFAPNKLFNFLRILCYLFAFSGVHLTKERKLQKDDSVLVEEVRNGSHNAYERL